MSLDLEHGACSENLQELSGLLRWCVLLDAAWLRLQCGSRVACQYIQNPVQMGPYMLLPSRIGFAQRVVCDPPLVAAELQNLSPRAAQYLQMFPCRFPKVHTVAFRKLDHRGVPTQGEGQTPQSNCVHADAMCARHMLAACHSRVAPTAAY